MVNKIYLFSVRKSFNLNNFLLFGKELTEKKYLLTGKAFTPEKKIMISFYNMFNKQINMHKSNG